MGADLWFVTGEGPRLSTISGAGDFAKLKGKDDIHDHLAPVYQTVKNLSSALPSETTLIGFAGAPWTVATYMIAGQGTPDQGPAHALKAEDRETFENVIDLLTDATIDITRAFSNGPHIFNLGHGITPDADPENVQLMIDTVRSFKR